MTTAILEGYEMSRRDRRKPSAPRVIADPAESARRGYPSEWGPNEAALLMPANSDVASKLDDRGLLTGRWRYDVFELLYRRRWSVKNPKGHQFPDPWYFAVRRFQEDLAILHRTQGASDAIRVTGKGATGALAAGEDAELIRFVTTGFGLPRVQAGARLNEVLGNLSRLAGKLLLALTEPEAASGSTVNWRAQLKRYGFDEHADQAKAVRHLCRDLADAYAEIDNEPKRAAG